MDSGFFKIANDGQDIAETDYFDTEQAQGGALYLSYNAGAARLLVPDAYVPLLAAELAKSRVDWVILSRGRIKGDPQRRQGLEMLFEDHSDQPFQFLITEGVQSDFILKAETGEEFVFSLWTRRGKLGQYRARFREVKQVPYLKEWGK